MKTLRFAIILAFIIMISCKEHPSKSFPDLIIGTWQRNNDLNTEPPPLPGVDKIKFTFMRDSGIFHPGFYYPIADYTEIGMLARFISNKFIYSFHNDILSMICPDEHDGIGTEVINYKILVINKDSLIVETNKKLILRFAKVTN